jgi:hypothetical protein
VSPHAHRLEHHAHHAAHHAGHGKHGHSADVPPLKITETLAELTTVVVYACGGAAVGAALVAVLRQFGLRWTWLLTVLVPACVVWKIDWHAGLALVGVAAGGALLGARWDWDDTKAGGDLAAKVKRRRGVTWGLRLLRARQAPIAPATDKGVLIGFDTQHRAVRIPTALKPSHTLVIGTTDSGKTVTQALILRRAIEAGCGAVVIDPKGDRLLHATVERAARAADKPLRVWNPQGQTSYNPFAWGSDSEVADKALGGEHYTEPHYQRQAQRYVAHAVRAQRALGQPVTLSSLVALLNPPRLDALARKIDPARAKGLHAYVDSLTPEQHRGLAGTRDRLAILAESDLGPRLEQSPDTIDLDRELRAGAVVLFSLQSDRWPLLSGMLAAAIVGDLITVTAARQSEPNPIPAVIAIDEFSAVSSEGVVRLFGRARSARLSLLLGTQELADLTTPEHPALLDQVLGNTATVIAHRQRVPSSAELLAQVAGTKGTWTQTRRVDGLSAPTDSGTRTRTREFHIHPDDLKNLPQGVAIAITDNHPPRRTHIQHPARTRG